MHGMYCTVLCCVKRGDVVWCDDVTGGHRAVKSFVVWWCESSELALPGLASTAGNFPLKSYRS